MPTFRIKKYIHSSGDAEKLVYTVEAKNREEAKYRVDEAHTTWLQTGRKPSNMKVEREN